MIFKQIDEILTGQKTQTRRVCKPGEGMYKDTLALSESGAVRWAVGKTYAVVPKRGQPAVWWRNEPWLMGYRPAYTNGPSAKHGAAHKYDRETYLAADGFRPLRIRITVIRQERLQDITEADAKAEGVADVAAYRELWESINGRTPGARWADSPLVWVLTFEVVKEKGAQS